MKRIALFLLIICCFFFAGCGQKLSMGESIYDGKFIVSGVGPEIGFEPTVDDGTLVLKGYFEDHSDHIFLNKGIWEEYLEEESDYLPGNVVRFKGVLKYLDGAAGNHYYEVKSIDKLEVANYPNEEEIMSLLDSYNYCESDSDCGYFMGECPLGCYIPLNVKYMDVASNIVANFVNHLDELCVYDCIEMNKARCENYKCEMYDAEASEDVHACGPVDNDPELSCDDGGYDLVCANDGKTYKNSCFACKEPLVETFTFGQCKNDLGVSYCTAYQKSADVCTMEYAPVCGSDSRTYGNSCVACQSETVESYTQGECENSAFVVEGDPENLSYLMGTFEKSVL